jgi:hypothetical protein
VTTFAGGYLLRRLLVTRASTLSLPYPPIVAATITAKSANNTLRIILPPRTQSNRDAA